MRQQKIILTQKLDSLFPDKTTRESAINLLDLYGQEAYEKEVIRVQLAILKLSGSDLCKIGHNTQRAKEDYRDVLAWAEYPRQSKSGSIHTGPDKDALVKEDKTEYLKWLES